MLEADGSASLALHRAAWRLCVRMTDMCGLLNPEEVRFFRLLALSACLEMHLAWPLLDERGIDSHLSQTEWSLLCFIRN